jgi:predicted RNase H-like HicB family nuclease
MSTSDNAILRYSMRIQWSDEDQVYIVDVPELPGCTTHGRTYEEAVTQAQDAISGWIYGQRATGYPIPKPNVYHALDRQFSNPSR